MRRDHRDVSPARQADERGRALPAPDGCDSGSRRRVIRLVVFLLLAAAGPIGGCSATATAIDPDAGTSDAAADEEDARGAEDAVATDDPSATDTAHDSDPADGSLPDGPGLTTGNAPPVLASIGDRRLAAGRSSTIRLSAIDEDGDELRYFGTGLPDGSRFDKRTGVFAWEPLDTEVGRVVLAVFGVRDEAGAEDRELVTLDVVRDAERTAPELRLPVDPVAWPAGEAHAWAVPAADADGDTLSYSLGAGAPPGMELDPADGILRWTAGSDDIGETIPIGLSVEDDDGLRDEGTLRVAVVGTPRDRLPPVSIVATEMAVVDLLPEATEGGGRDAFSCALEGDAPAGLTVTACRLRWTPPLDAAGDTVVVGVVIDDARTEQQPDRIREVQLNVGEAARCEPATEIPATPETLAFDEAGFAFVEGTLCSPDAAPVLRYAATLPSGTDRLDALLVFDATTGADLDLEVDCGAAAYDASLGTGEEEYVSLDVDGAATCEVRALSFVTVPVATRWDITLLAGEEVTCTDDAEPVSTPLAVGDLAERRSCPGLPDEIPLDAAVAGAELVTSGADLDLELIARAGGAEDRVLEIAVSVGETETIRLPEGASLRAGEQLLVRVVPYEVPAEGVDFLLEALPPEERDE